MNFKNCQTELQLTSNYCYECGGKIIEKRLTIKNLIEHLVANFF